MLAGSFFPQIFGLPTPRFFRVAVDRVPVHRGSSTLEVPALGLALRWIFQVTLGGKHPPSNPACR